jgi:hypothetical protein
VCPDCLVDLVDDPDAAVRCRHCGRAWPATMDSCPVCLAELRPDPAVAAEALGDILGKGGHLFRPDHLPAFRDGPSCTLLRLSGRGSLVFLGGDGLVEAEVDGPGGRAAPPLTCRDVDGTVLFTLVRYEAAEDAVVALDADGDPLATFLRAGRGIDVRDETSAPAAALRPVRGGFDLVETGGAGVARVGTDDVEREDWVDDQWWLATGAGTLPVRPLAAVALVLAAKVLLGRSSPVPSSRDEQEEERDAWRPFD